MPSVGFYFKVVFQKPGQAGFQASFLEVSGLSWDMGKKSTRHNDGSHSHPTGLSYGNVTLKRPLGPLSASLAQWIKECQDFLSVSRKQKDMKAIPTYDVIIHLLDEEANPKASWQCRNAYLMKWSLGGFDSGKSELLVETIELAFDYLERVK